MVKSEKYLIKKYDGDPACGVDSSEAEGITITITGKLYVVMIDWKYLSHNTIAHELYHVTRRITDDRDISDEESVAWLAGYLSQEFYKFLGSSKVKKEFDKLTDKPKNGEGSAK
jgi:hypothetical protein